MHGSGSGTRRGPLAPSLVGRDVALVAFEVGSRRPWRPLLLAWPTPGARLAPSCRFLHRESGMPSRPGVAA
eukprot:6614045-Pyramimonas_sp.AAC.1